MVVAMVGMVDKGRRSEVAKQKVRKDEGDEVAGLAEPTKNFAVAKE